MLKHHLTAEEIVEHYREVSATLTNAGCLPKRRAGMLLKSMQTLKQYGTMPPSPQHRLVPPEDLQRLRDEAVRLHWDFADRATGEWIRAEAVIGTDAIAPRYYTPTGANHLSKGRISFLPRAVELAELHGGYINEIDLDEARALIGTERFLTRSRWRRAVYALSAAGRRDFVRGAASAHGYCEHVIGQIGSEYAPWRVSVTPALLDAVETASKEVA